MEQIVQSNNLFVDSDRGESTGISKGDDFTVHLNSQGLDADRGQYLRVTLNEFAMNKNWSDVNENNNKIVTRYSGGTTAVSIVLLTKQNYSTIYDLATNFADELAKDIITSIGAVSACAVSNLTPDNTTAITGTTDNIISFTLTTTGNHGLTDLKLQSYEGKGDSYALLGGNRIVDGTDATTNSFDVTIVNATTITVKAFYPAQRSTTSYVYLRTSLLTQAIETSSLSASTDQSFMEDTNPTNILARIPVNTEYCVFNSATGREFFVNLHQKHIQSIRLYLTDEHNRPIGRGPADSSLTASGTGLSQSVLGNLSFSAVLRIDVVQASRPNELLAPVQGSSLPARYNNLMLSPSGY
jgi:hypothetical protein